MPSPDFPTLYRFEDYIEAAVVSILADNSVTAFRQRGLTENTTPRVEVQLTVGPAIEHYVKNSSNENFLNTWQGTLRLGIITKRSSAGAAEHVTYRSKVRYLMQRLSLFTVTLLPYHTISKIIESGTQPEAIQDEHHDASVVTFDIWWQILPAAFPAT